MPLQPRIKMLFIIMICYSPALAQFVKGVGIKTGLTRANQDYKYSSGILEKDIQFRSGFTFGVFAEFSIMSHISLSAEMHYTQKGAVDEQIMTDENSPEPRGTLVWNHCIHYLSVPFLIKLSTKTGFLDTYFIFGPRVDLWLASKLNLDSDDFVPPNLDLDDPVYDELERMTVGCDVGIGFEKNILKSSSLMLEFRYSPDLTEAYKHEFLNIYNRAFTVLLGFSI
jgi:hypothetical protein